MGKMSSVVLGLCLLLEPPVKSKNRNDHLMYQIENLDYDKMIMSFCNL